jgi:hypothetical protein
LRVIACQKENGFAVANRRKNLLLIALTTSVGKAKSILQPAEIKLCLFLPPHPSLRDTFSPRAKAF